MNHGTKKKGVKKHTMGSKVESYKHGGRKTNDGFGIVNDKTSPFTCSK